MGQIKKEEKIHFPEGHVWVLWDVGDDEFGYCIEVLGEEGDGGPLVGIGSWTFGEERWSNRVWDAWGDYVVSQFKKEEGKKDVVMGVVECLNMYDCHFDLEDDTHLKDLNTMIKLLKLN